MKKLIEILKNVLCFKKAVEPVQYKIYMPGETLPYDKIEDIEFEIVK